MTDSEKSTLGSLYRQRRQRHPAPETLQEALHDRVRSRRHQKRRSRWVTMVPTLASMALLVVILRPLWLPQPDMSAELATTRTAMTAESLSGSAPALAEERSAKAVPKPQAPAPSPSMSSDEMASVPMAEFSAAPEASVQADTVSRLATPNADKPIREMNPEQMNGPLYLFIDESHLGQAITCSGERFRLPDSLEGTDWVEVRWENEQWTLQMLDGNPCR